MSQKMRIASGIGLLIIIVLAVLGIEALRRIAPVLLAAGGNRATPAVAAKAVTLVPGSVPIFYQGKLASAFDPQDLEKLKKVSFTEPVEGKTEEGWLLRDVLLLYLQPSQLQADTQVVVSSSSRKKSARLSWAEIDKQENMVMFDLANRGTLKLASKLERLSTRDEWVQDVDKIEVGGQ